MEFLKDVLGEELYAQLEEKLKDNKDIKLANLADGKYVAKAKYEDDLQAKDAKIQELTDQVKNFDGVDVKKLQEDVENWKTKYSSDIATERLNSAVKLAVAKSGTKSEKALIGMLDYNKITLNDKGEIEGLDDQIAMIKKEDAFLFEAEPQPTIDVVLGGGHSGQPTPKSEPTTIAEAIYQNIIENKEK